VQLHGINFDPDHIAAFCRRHGVARLSLFGSILRDDFGPESDVDVLVEFLPNASPSLFDMGRMQQELVEMLGRGVDLKTPDFLSRYFRNRVMREAVVQYAA
jgi:predicted nucleotidyltransferase